VEVGVGGLVHVIFGPLAEALRLDGLAAEAVQLLPLEVVAGTHLQKPVDLLAHLKLTIKL
jgi:hypothetical protein